MKLLVATHDTQGQKKGDFCWAREGEPVVDSLFWWDGFNEHTTIAENLHRSMTGLRTGKATSTAMVADVPGMTRRKLAGLIEAYSLKHSLDINANIDKSDCDSVAAGIMNLANDLAVGTVVEKRQSTGIVPRLYTLAKEKGQGAGKVSLMCSGGGITQVSHRKPVRKPRKPAIPEKAFDELVDRMMDIVSPGE